MTSGRGPIYNLVGSEVWSYIATIQKLLWALLTEGSHLSHLSAQGVYMTEVTVPRLDTWWSAPSQSAYMTTAMVGHMMCKKNGMKEPVAAMLEALIFIRVSAPATLRHSGVGQGASGFPHEQTSESISQSYRFWSVNGMVKATLTALLLGWRFLTTSRSTFILESPSFTRASIVTQRRYRTVISLSLVPDTDKNDIPCSFWVKLQIIHKETFMMP